MYLTDPTEHGLGMRAAWERARRDGLSPRELADLASRLRLIKPRDGIEPKFKLNKIERREVAEMLILTETDQRGDHRLLGMERSTWNRIVREVRDSVNGGPVPSGHAGFERHSRPNSQSVRPSPYSREKGYTKFTFDATSGASPITLDEALEVAWEECQDLPAYWNLGLSREEIAVATTNRRAIHDGGMPMPTLAGLLEHVRRYGRADGVLEAGWQLPLREYELLERAWRKAPKPDRPKVRRRA